MTERKIDVHVTVCVPMIERLDEAGVVTVELDYARGIDITAGASPTDEAEERKTGREETLLAADALVREWLRRAS